VGSLNLSVFSRIGCLTIIQYLSNSTSRGIEKRMQSESQPKQQVKKRSRHIPLSIRFAVLQRDGHKCVSCGESAPKVTLEVDHKVAFSKGGSNDLSNLQTLCFDYNRGKGARS
jgi:5-methylcytosine-specific restriction endonuclease McrA